MEPTPNIRESLINKLDELKEKRDTNFSCIRHEMEKENPEKIMLELFNLEIWLIDQQISTIKETLINNHLKDW